MPAEQLPMVRIERSHGTVAISFAVTAIDKQNFVAVVDELEVVSRSPKAQSVVIDLTGVRRIDELGLVILQALQDSIKDVGGTARFCGPIHLIERAINETRLAREIDLREAHRTPSQWTQW